MSPRLSHFAAALVFSAAVLHAENAGPAKTEPTKTEPPKADAAKAEPVAPFELKNRSKFTVAADPSGRAPFWPIGWVKREKGAVAQAAAPVVPRVLIDEKSFKVTSILLGTGTTPSLAVINGRAYSEGEFLRMPKGGTALPVRVRVQRINDGTVILQNADQVLVASLTRPELASKKADELLLDPDR